MRLHGRRVDQNLDGRPARTGKSVEKVGPDAFLGPSDIAVIERFLRPVIWRRIDPAPAGLQHMDDPADHPPVINPRLAPRVCRQMRRKQRKLCFAQPELVPIHSNFPSEAVNHAALIMPTFLWVWTLVIPPTPAISNRILGAVVPIPMFPPSGFSVRLDALPAG